ncbi:ABC transporter substrate-binding protein [Frankia sp. AgB1.9]|uniref:ABC transporter substrate-binding protein n=1 Tax=unclassified Frankia TaxID=2632575 RepID=UPI0019346506|nr:MULTISPECIES: ABC transporter substrate-binding protein [unclassified Frankia]MBL7486896.1 ABC transporter substrate-binding protein [Frankia sp. AgW1.1]MBL7547217.1 ABC transporter substrate-binding protein [Frankia sp. AgB1.9]MBL7623991.1 ABC transporter substrate-binding protein [Frankia sp. AgB1.8]
MSLRRLRARAGIAAIAATLVGLPATLTACGTVSRGTADGAVRCATRVPGVTGTSIKIGLIYPDSGIAEIARTFGPARNGVEARIDQQNARGGVNGRRIHLVWGDDQSEVDKFSRVAHDLVDNQQVFGLIATSIVLEDSADWLDREGIPVTGTATSARWGDYGNLFTGTNLFNAGGTSVYGDYVSRQGGTKALVVVDPSVQASQNFAMQLVPSLRSRRVSVVGEITYTPQITSTAYVAQRFKDLGADTLIGATQPTAVIDVYAQARALGAKIKVALNSGGVTPGLLAQRGDDMAGMSFLSTFAFDSSPATKAYLNAMNIYAPELPDPTDGLAVAGYGAADEMIQGLELAGACPTRQAFIQNLRKVTDFTGGGLIPPVDLTKPRQPVLCAAFIRVDQAGRNIVVVPPPADLDRDGYWCGAPLQ